MDLRFEFVSFGKMCKNKPVLTSALTGENSDSLL